MNNAPRISTLIQRIVNNVRGVEPEESMLDSFFETNNRGMAIDSLTYKNKIKNGLKLIASQDTIPEDKIRLGNYFCNSITDMCSLSFDKLEIIERELIKVIYEGISMIPPVRLRYLRFKNESVSYKISIAVYNCGIRETISQMMYFQILKYILRSYKATQEEKQPILDEFEAMFADEAVSLYTKMEIADIFILNGRVDRGNQMLDIIRGIEEANAVARAANTVHTVYSDSQNVHDTSINNSVLKASIKLIQDYPTEGYDSMYVLECLAKMKPDCERIIENVIHRIEVDTSRFSVPRHGEEGTDMFSLYNLFSSIWVYIEKHKYSSELKERLIEEMVSMANYCTTGHLSRLINVIQGYDEHDQYAITISDGKQIDSVITHYLNTDLMNADEKIMEAMTESDKTPFYLYIQEKINVKIREYLEEYGDVSDYILAAVKKYSNYNDWKIVDNKLIII